jgi:ATP-dependent helicase/DNAse subunit B
VIAKFHLVTGPPGPGLTARLQAEYLARVAQVGSCLWLVPSERAAGEAVRRIARGGRPIFSPNVFSLRGFCDAVLSSAGVPAPSQSPSAWRQIVQETAAELARTGRLSFFQRVAESRGFLDGAEGLLDELTAAGVTPDQLPLGDGPRAKKLAAISNLYAAALERWPGPIEPVGAAVDVIRAGPPRPFDAVRFVFVAGFRAFTSTEWGLLKALAIRADLWVALPNVADGGCEAFAAVAETRTALVAAFGEPAVVLPPAIDRPPGLGYLSRHLFGDPVAPTDDAAGVSLIEAPGPVGEARLIARRVRGLIADGVRPGDIVVTARDPTYARDLLGEVFAEYGLPVEMDGTDTLVRNPAVATLLRAVRLPMDGWPFAAVTALLRSTYFRPTWDGGPDAARRSETLLRLLGEPRGRDAYLRAVRLWAETPPGGLEDEEAEESRRRSKARLAAECRPFLEGFFAAWDGLPETATPRAFADWIADFARDIGLTGAADEDPADRAALRALFQTLGRWSAGATSRVAFLRGLMTIAASEPMPRCAESGGRVRVVATEDARHLDCDYLFILGLGEKSFPRLAPPRSLLDDGDRQFLREAGLPLEDPSARLANEQLLFLDLIARPRRGLVLSYAAVDEKGQPLLEGSFLRSVRECFVAEAIPVERQRMLIEGYTTRAARSPAEARVQFAAGRRSADGLGLDLCEHLQWAEEVAAARFRTGDYNRYDGWLNHPVTRELVGRQFGPAKVFSPTALEAYIACPFRFLLEHVLRLQELDEPGEEVEHTRRGAAYHRALSRLHRKLRESQPNLTQSALPEEIGPRLLAEIDTAVAEYAARAPSPASKRLWELEGRRLHRSAARYRAHWDAFIDPWRKARAYLSPDLLEADFGLTEAKGGVEAAPAAPLLISVDGVEVRIGGRIDRVDVAELDGGLGFWVIDYKTGRSTNYTASGLTNLEKLQLPLYALAVEQLFLAGKSARPLGLAYWMVTDTGPKPVLPGSRGAAAWQNDPKKWVEFRARLEAWVAKVVGRIREGHFPLAPRSPTCTLTCSFGQVCRISQSRNVGKLWDLAPPAAEQLE